MFSVLKTYVQEIKKLSKLGLTIKVYNEKEMKKLGLNALLGVGQGSINNSYLVTIEWKGKSKTTKDHWLLLEKEFVLILVAFL